MCPGNARVPEVATHSPFPVSYTSVAEEPAASSYGRIEYSCDVGAVNSPANIKPRRE
jgi:hypothetical protein